jgi:hypothetical protein
MGLVPKIMGVTSLGQGPSWADRGRPLQSVLDSAKNGLGQAVSIFVRPKKDRLAPYANA